MFWATCPTPGEPCPAGKAHCSLIAAAAAPAMGAQQMNHGSSRVQILTCTHTCWPFHACRVWRDMGSAEWQQTVVAESDRYGDLAEW